MCHVLLRFFLGLDAVQQHDRDDEQREKPAIEASDALHKVNPSRDSWRAAVGVNAERLRENSNAPRRNPEPDSLVPRRFLGVRAVLSWQPRTARQGSDRWTGNSAAVHLGLWSESSEAGRVIAVGLRADALHGNCDQMIIFQSGHSRVEWQIREIGSSGRARQHNGSQSQPPHHRTSSFQWQKHPLPRRRAGSFSPLGQGG